MTGQIAVRSIASDVQAAVTVREIHDQIAPAHPVAYTTTASTCARLVEKRLLARHRGPRGPHVYTPLIDERTFVTQAIKQLIACVARDYPDVLSH